MKLFLGYTYNISNQYNTLNLREIPFLLLGKDIIMCSNLLDQTVIDSFAEELGAEIITDTQINFYSEKDKWGEFSNFYPYKIDKIKTTIEHKFQAEKFRGPIASAKSLEYSKLIEGVNTPGKSKMLANQKRKGGYASTWVYSKEDPRKLNDIILEYSDVKMRPDWEEVKDNVMEELLLEKFQSSPSLKNILLKTYPLDLAEHTPRDKYWGDGLDGSGKNKLGKLLTKIRNKMLNQ